MNAADERGRMSGNARGEVPEEMDGLSTEEAVDRILDRDDSLDRDAVRERLEYVTHDGVVCRDGIEEGLGDVSQVISTPENRIDLARREFETAAEAAAPVSDLAVVDARLAEYEGRLLALKDEVDRLGPELNELFNEWLDEPDDVYAMADGLYQHASRAQRMHGLVDELITDLESFQAWVEDPAVRFDELERDVEGVEDSLADIDGALVDLADADEPDKTSAEADDEDPGDGTDIGGDEELEPVFVWVDAALRHRLVGLLITDLRVELDGLRAWGDRENARDEARESELEERIDGLRNQWEALDGRLDDAARPAWRERFEDRLSAFEDDLDAFEPPIDWGEVQRTLQEHRGEIGPEA